MLVTLSGLLGTGKTTLARAVAARLPGVHLRIDTIEQAAVDAGADTHPVGPVGYYVGCALSTDHLRQGLSVVVDCVNPLAVTRDGWRDIARRAGAALLEVEVTCSDPSQHQDRLRTRHSDIPGMPEPSWQKIHQIEYEPWSRERLVVDTATLPPDDAVEAVLVAARSLASPR